LLRTLSDDREYTQRHQRDQLLHVIPSIVADIGRRGEDGSAPGFAETT
jgi:hypothetical protein